jgi:hypothetical protein
MRTKCTLFYNPNKVLESTPVSSPVKKKQTTLRSFEDHDEDNVIISILGAGNGNPTSMHNAHASTNYINLQIALTWIDIGFVNVSEREESQPQQITYTIPNVMYVPYGRTWKNNSCRLAVYCRPTTRPKIHIHIHIHMICKWEWNWN